MGEPYEISNRNGYGFLGYAYFFACTTTTSPKRISIKDSWDMHAFLVVQLIPGISGKSIVGVYIIFNEPSSKPPLDF